MSVQVAKKIPFHPLHCPDCQHYYSEINRCRAYAIESWPKPLLGIFSGESEEPCEKFNPKPKPTNTLSDAQNEDSLPPFPIRETAPPIPAPLPAEIQPQLEPRIHCQKCKAENSPDQLRCAYCRADLLPGEGLIIRLATLVLSWAGAAFFGRLAYVIATQTTEPNPFLDDPVKPALIAVALFFGGLLFLFRRTPRHSRFTNRADRHLGLNLKQALQDYSRALEVAPNKERAEILRKRAAAHEKMGMMENATRDQIAYTYEQGAYAFGSNLTGLFGGDREGYALNRAKTERRQLLTTGRAVACGFCPQCKDAIELTTELHCPIHPKARIQDSRLFVPSEIESGRKWILEARSRKRFDGIKKVVRWAVILLLGWFALTTLYRVVIQPNGSSSKSNSSPPASVVVPSEVVTEATFNDGDISFAYPSDWEIVTSTDRQTLLRTTLKGLADYEYIGGVYTIGVETCESCAHMVLVTIQAPEEGPLTPEQYEQVKAEAQISMGSRLLDHQMMEFDGVPAAVSQYIGLSQETRQWDVILLAPGEKRVMMFSCSAHRDEYERFEPLFERAMETLTFGFAKSGSSTTTIQPEQTEIVPAVMAIAIVDRSGASINVRSGAGTEYGVVGGLPRNSEVEVLGRNLAGDWLKINGPSGWIYAELVSLSVPVESLPIIE